MEGDSSNVDLMDTIEYLFNNVCDFDFPDLFEESGAHYANITQNNPHDDSINETSESIFASFCETKTSNIAATTTNKSSSPPSSSSSPSQFICFKNSYSSPPTDTLNFSNLFDTHEQYGSQGMPEREDCLGKRHPQLLKENAIAEKQRRQRLNQRLKALQSLLPGRKKADKITVLDDAIKYMKQLQERIQQLEQQRGSADNEFESVSQFSDQMLPQIEARVSNNEILIRVHCEKSKGCVAKILIEMDKLRLDVINTFTFPFGNSTFHTTILAKMDKNHYRSVKDVVNNIRLAMVE